MRLENEAFVLDSPVSNKNLKFILTNEERKNRFGGCFTIYIINGYCSRLNNIPPELMSEPQNKVLCGNRVSTNIIS